MRRHTGQLIALLCGAAVFLCGILWQETDGLLGAREWLRVMSNAALLPGVLLVGLSLLMRISGEGFFDGLRYTMSSMLARLRGAKKQYASYYEYTQRERKRMAGAPLLLPGLLFLAAAIVMTLLYYL